MPLAKGKLVVKKSKGIIVVETSYDFAQYYKWFIERYFKIQVACPAYRPHVSLALPEFHKNVNWNRALFYKGNVFDFFYSENVKVGGFSKNFRNFFLDVYSKNLLDLCRELGIQDNRRGFHITVANTKNMGRRDWWPQMVTLS